MRLLIAEQQHSAYAALLQQAEPALELCVGNALTELTRHAADCELWLGQPDLLAGLLRQGFKPSWLQSTWAGITPLLAADLPRDYRLSRAVGIFGQLMAEYLLTYLLAHERQLLARAASQQQLHWDDRTPNSLAGRRVLLVGCGEIGDQVAQLLAPFGLQLFGIASRARVQAPFQQVLGLAHLAEQAAQADYLINLLPDTPVTADIFDAAVFAQMKPGALFINAGRGAAVVDADLLAALTSGQLAGAVLDVCRSEPLPAAHPFWTAPRLLLTGHSAAPTLPAPMVELFLHNLQAYRAGMPLRGQVEFARGY
ncbi:MAG: hydroxyacid dehydrogenase [Pseudomonadales bacterium RIFCSPLOWO2_12_59_9]|nr:MAG: hydroxyacid dehydrogenase [Pseudomonadales bacterium RIFCSPLOWO2_12_59_9]